MSSSFGVTAVHDVSHMNSVGNSAEIIASQVACSAVHQPSSSDASVLCSHVVVAAGRGQASIHKAAAQSGADQGTIGHCKLQRPFYHARAGQPQCSIRPAPLMFLAAAAAALLLGLIPTSADALTPLGEPLSTEYDLVRRSALA